MIILLSYECSKLFKSYATIKDQHVSSLNHYLCFQTSVVLVSMANGAITHEGAVCQINLLKAQVDQGFGFKWPSLQVTGGCTGWRAETWAYHFSRRAWNQNFTVQWWMRSSNAFINYLLTLTFKCWQPQSNRLNILNRTVNIWEGSL